MLFKWFNNARTLSDLVAPLPVAPVVPFSECAGARADRQSRPLSASLETGKPNGDPALIALREVSKAFHSPGGDFRALQGVNLEIAEGEFVSIIGKSGSGKTTLINLITGIDSPTAGEIFVGGTPVHQLNEGQMATWRAATWASSSSSSSCCRP
jgi:ABC-type glutathione transport system ATPase component